ncbi:hydroxymethylglutaryl-CoA lyase [Trypanosoma grayi]|uniref:hydroxymethylglutaryl-CoA lyase n=1 Tax=Trypanosoma grayi TaxID=71804 RepID=UPI0004F4492D|nr:hydroxymethylglutaryl-CoA lyase [Trypanosoma grayi]KEG12526.1 hydroxymethylglutaryl-CoA lyase [Trypanosoma grayi]
MMQFSRTHRSPIRLVECPRDAMQGLTRFVPTAQKIRYLNALLKCGFYAIDCASFVSPRAVPQMRDSAEVLAGFDHTLIQGEQAPKISVVIASLAGFKQALSTPIVSTIGFPLACCERFQQLNTRKSIGVALDEIAHMQAAVAAANTDMKPPHGLTLPLGPSKEKELVVYLSMAFGNPYGEPHSVAVVEQLAARLVSLGVRTISLADTVGVSQPQLIYDTFMRLQRSFSDVTFGAHFHSNTVTSKEKLLAAVEAGCTLFDSALGGMGGCPFAANDLTGNVATETVVKTLQECRILSPTLNLKQVQDCVLLKQEIFGVSVKDMLLSQSLRDEKRFAQLCQEHFRLYDANDSGTLDYECFRSCMMQVFTELGGEPPSEQKIRSSFHKVDIQKLGCITVDAYTMGARRLLMKRLGLCESVTSNENTDSKRTISA